MCLTSKHYSYFMLMYLLFMFTSMSLWMVMLRGRKVDWILSPITEGCASEELSLFSFKKSLSWIHLLWCISNYDRKPSDIVWTVFVQWWLTDCRWYISMCWKYYLKIYNLGYDIACDVLQAQPWLTFRPSAFFMRTEHRLPENAQLGISSLVA